MFKAILINKQDGAQSVQVADVDDAQLPDAPVTVRVEYSTINYKDGLAITGKSPVVRKFPMVPGIDFAMEHPGLVTYSQALMVEKAGRETLHTRREYAGVCAHEIAHMWFGNLVTAAWWNDLWLNEGMATWMESRIVEKWRPAYGARLDAVVSAHDAMDADGLAAARAVRQPVTSTSEAHEAFDEITYEKGAAVLTT